MRPKLDPNKIFSVLIPVLGIAFMLWYIRAAGADVVYSDYIRIVSEYLPDVSDPGKFFVPDVLTRIPATYVARIINVNTFGYSVNFDRVLSVAGIAAMALCLAIYISKHDFQPVWKIFIAIVLFSLNKWEIILNGTAWSHVAAFGLFFASYLLMDGLWTGEADAKRELALCVMPFVLLLFAGEYIASYAVTMILTCLLGMASGGANGWAGKRERGLFKFIMIMTAIALLIYMVSRHFAVWEHSGATDESLVSVISENPAFLPKLFIKSFAGAVIGQETIYSFIGGRALPDAAVLAVGIFMIALYMLAFVLYFMGDMLEKTVFPLVLLTSGFINHCLVAASRWIFLNENYAMSSRYSCQFMVGIIGMLIIFALFGTGRKRLRRSVQRRQAAIKTFVTAAAVFIAAGNCYTTYQEITKAKYREANYEHMAEVLIDYENQDIGTLMETLEWNKDAGTLMEAVSILKDNKLNVFGQLR